MRKIKIRQPKYNVGDKIWLVGNRTAQAINPNAYSCNYLKDVPNLNKSKTEYFAEQKTIDRIRIEISESSIDIQYYYGFSYVSENDEQKPIYKSKRIAEATALGMTNR